MVWPGPRGKSPMIKMIEKPGSAKKLDSDPFMRNPIEPNLLDQTHQTKPIRPAQTKYKPIKAHFFLKRRTPLQHRGARLFDTYSKKINVTERGVIHVL